ncbi:MAG: hypothetical protein HY897_03065 [Deltaproteobacteria bacterium]|nr:hypothetical protein [Deltaproteobacteria bacterium]
MLATILIAGTLFGMMLLILWNGYRNVELSRLDAGERERPAAQAADPVAKRCVLCNAPLASSATRDEVVHELQRRIDVERAWVVDFLDRPAPEVFARYLYQGDPSGSQWLRH